MLRNVIYFFSLFLFVISCADTFSSVKRGLTGEKANTADEFLVKKKDPLILPPDFEDLPIPDDRILAESNSIFEDIMEDSSEDTSSTSNSVEDSILKKIQSK